MTHNALTGFVGWLFPRANAALLSFVWTMGFAAQAAGVTPETLPPTVRWTNSGPVAFARGTRLHICFTNEGFAFNAQWKKPRVASQEFGYVAATIECDESPPDVATLSPRWEPVRTIERAESERLLHSALTRLAPANRRGGVYVQLSTGDAVLYRGARGEAKWVRFEDKPADVEIERRYGRQEFASLLAQTLEAHLRTAYSNETRFLATLILGRPRLLYLDLEQRQSVVLSVPRPGHDPGRPVLGKNVKALVSFALVDNAWSFLKNPVSSTTRTVHQGLQWGSVALQPKLRPRDSTPPVISNRPAMDLVAWEQWLDKHAGAPRERGAVRLLIDGEKFFPHFERRIAEAQSNINIHVCIFDRDDVAARMADALKARSTSIAVKVIFDRLNSKGAGGAPPATPMNDGFVAPDSIRKYLRAGSRVQVRPQLNPGFTCDHSKVFLIDERFAYIGGMNFGREYRYEWHDLMAEVEGPVVASLQRQFDRKWAQTSVWGDGALALAALKPHRTITNEPPGAISLRRLYTKTFDRQIRSAQLAAINRAQNHVFLENAYLYSNDMIVALLRARQRGVDVRVIMPGENDFASGHSSNLVTANYLRQHGVRVYFYPGMSHVKALLVDGWVCFGSANFDALSLQLNRECNLATSDAEFAGTFRREVFETDLGKSRELTSDVSVGLGDHLSDALMNPF